MARGLYVHVGVIGTVVKCPLACCPWALCHYCTNNLHVRVAREQEHIMREIVREEECDTTTHLIKNSRFTHASRVTKFSSLTFKLELRKCSAVTNSGLDGHYTVIRPISVSLRSPPRFWKL